MLQWFYSEGVVEDIVKCVQIIPDKSVLYKMYENAIGETNMAVLSSFKKLSMYNFGVKVITEMADADRAYLEQNLNVALQSGQLDLTDIQAIRQLKDPDQAERLMSVRIAKRRDSKMQEQQMQAQMTSAVKHSVYSSGSAGRDPKETGRIRP